MPRVKKLPRGFWDSPEGRKALAKLGPQMTAADLARELGTTEAAVYNAASRHRRPSISGPMIVDQSFVDRVIRFAEDVIGEAVTLRLKQSQEETARLQAENDQLRADLNNAQLTTREQASTLESLQARLAERVLKVAGPGKGD